MSYDFELDLESRNSLSILIERIKPNSTILEFGPAHGRMTKHLKENLNCKVYCVEIDPLSAKNTTQFSEKMVVGDIETHEWIAEFEPLQFDYIIFADVLEHLKNPQKILLTIKKFLKKDGSVLISIPNISHNAIILSLINNDFQYSDTGLLDSTHVKFFTKKTFDELLQETGYFTAYETGIFVRPENTEFQIAYEDFPLEIATFLAKQNHGEVYQYIYELKTHEVEKTTELVDKEKRFNEKYIELFMDLGNGFEDKNTQSLKFAWQEEIYFELNPLGNVKKIRLDPLNDYVILKLRQIEINGEIVSDFEVQSNALFVKNNRYYFNSGDPQIFIENQNSTPINSIKISLEYLSTGAQALNDINNYLVNQDIENKGTIEDLNFTIESIYNSRSWRYTYFLRYGRDTARDLKRRFIFTANSLKRKFTSVLILVKKVFFNLKHNGLRATYRKITHHLKSRKFIQQNNFREKKLLNLPLTNKLSYQKDMKICAVIHVFYIDVLEEILYYLDHIPQKIDLFISISKDIDEKILVEVLKNHGHLNFEITKVENRGRDVAPFLTCFGKKLLEYDVCCKLHGKKSLYSGSERKDWRNHLYFNLLGSKEIVNDIIKKFILDKKIGLVFSDNFGLLPYWGYTWLTNKEQAKIAFDKFNLYELAPILDKNYIDYPAGNMFWFRPDAIRQLLNSSVTIEDFPQEPIGNDGTISHAIERLFAYVCSLNQYDFIELNYTLGKYSLNTTHKNFNQHEAKTLEMAKNIVATKDYIIFDIFDTLLTRNIFAPDNLFHILEFNVDRKFNIKSHFFQKRKETEALLRYASKTDKEVTYFKIYEEMKKLKLYSDEVIEYLVKNEFALELNALKPKKYTIELYKYAIERDKKVFLVSDMYLTKKQILTLFETFNLPIQEKNLYLSSDVGYRKDNGSMWKYLCENIVIKPHESLVIGDNEVSDVKIPGDFGIESFHLMSEKNCLFESFLKNSLNQKEIDLVFLGPIINKLFESPFELSTNLYQMPKLNPYEFGFLALGPIMYSFMDHLYLKSEASKIYFLARDGYFLKEIFDFFVQSKDNLKTDTEYLLISRRAILGAIEKNESNLEDIIMHLGSFKGRFSELIASRLGITKKFLKDAGIEDFKISNKKDLKHAFDLLVKNLDSINNLSKNENENFTNYLRNIGFFENSNITLVDLGFSGTIQNYLQQFTQVKLRGEYFVTTNKITKIESSVNSYNGYFANQINSDDFENIIYRYALILESYLTSDKGQLLHFDSKGQPIFKQESKDLTIHHEVTQGIKDYIRELSFINAGFAQSSKTIKESSIKIFDYVLAKNLIDENLKKIFVVDDDFTGKSTLNVIEILAQRNFLNG